MYTYIYMLMGSCADRMLCGVMRSPTLGCDRYDASNRVWNPVWNPVNNPVNNPVWSQRREAANTATNLLRVANNIEIAATSKMTIGMNACTVMCECINVVSTDLPCA